MKYDVLIIGAGLSGCACARLLAQGGLNVLAIDRVDLSRKDKLCGGLLTPRAVKVFERLYGAEATGVYSSHHTRMKVIVGGRSKILDDVSVRGTWRKDLDRFALAKALEAGATIWDQTRVEELYAADGKAVLLHEGESCTVEFDYLIAADGASSVTRRMVCDQYTAHVHETSKGDILDKLGHPNNPNGSDSDYLGNLGNSVLDSVDNPSILGRQSTLADSDNSSRTGKRKPYEPRFARPIPAEVVPSIEAYVEPSGAPLSGMCDTQVHGYGWYIPCGEGAVIGIDGAIGTSRTQLDAALDSFADMMGVTLEGCSMRGAVLPCGGTILLQLGGPGTPTSVQQAWPHATYFLGDAAGLAAPATGEGIYYALRSAEVLAKSLLAETASYRTLMRSEAATLMRQYAAVPFLFSQKIQDRLAPVAKKTGVGPETMARPFLKIFASF